MASPEQSAELVSPRTREVLRQLELQARTIVTGIRYGLHKSRRRGVSTDFLHHRGYNVGDSLKHLDWRVFARTERYYIRQYIEDSAMTMWTVVDFSASMTSEPEEIVRNDEPRRLPAKWEVTAQLGAALSCLVMNQQDRAGVVISGGETPVTLPPSASPRQLGYLSHRLSSAPKDGRADMTAALRFVEEHARGSTVVSIVSDLSFPSEEIQRVIRNLRARNHDVIIFRVSTPNEASFPFNRWVDFRCPETPGLHHRIDATLLRQIYREEVGRFLEEWHDFCRRQRVDFVEVRTDANLTDLLNAYLRRRIAEG